VQKKKYTNYVFALFLVITCKQEKNEKYQVMSRGSSRSFSTFTTTFQFVVTFTVGPGNSPFIAITFQNFKKNNDQIGLKKVGRKKTSSSQKEEKK
jgi:hypothetical protein